MSCNTILVPNSPSPVVPHHGCALSWYRRSRFTAELQIWPEETTPNNLVGHVPFAYANTRILSWYTPAPRTFTAAAGRAHAANALAPCNFLVITAAPDTATIARPQERLGKGNQKKYPSKKLGVGIVIVGPGPATISVAGRASAPATRIVPAILNANFGHFLRNPHETKSNGSQSRLRGIRKTPVS